MKLVLFDIDGTLLWTDGAGRRAIQRALLDEAGTAGPIERYRFDGKTDPQIVRDLLSLAGHPAAEDASRIDAVCRRYVEHLRAELAAPAQATRLMPGTLELLAALEPHEAGQRALVGLLTGNVAPGWCGRARCSSSGATCSTGASTAVTGWRIGTRSCGCGCSGRPPALRRTVCSAGRARTRNRGHIGAARRPRPTWEIRMPW